MFIQSGAENDDLTLRNVLLVQVAPELLWKHQRQWFEQIVHSGSVTFTGTPPPQSSKSSELDVLLINQMEPDINKHREMVLI